MHNVGMKWECPDSRLEELLDDRASGSHLPDVTRHVENCVQCQQRLLTLAAEHQDWKQLKHSLSPELVDQGIEHELKEKKHNWLESFDVSESAEERSGRELLQPSRQPELLGCIGRYEVESVVGTGGMGIVYKGFDRELNRPVAIKALAPHLSRSGSARARFAREGRAAAAIVHEHVTAIHNVEVDGQSPFLVMQYIAGQSLQARVDESGPLEVCEILRIAMQTARGLAAAHEQGIIHRDVKPSNVLLEYGVERALLTDFGLARAADDANMTQSGFHPGTPHYMSPEQARGDLIDHRSDLFSLGSLIYFMCTGHPPFRAEKTLGVLHRINQDTPRSLRSINASVPDWLVSLVDQLLQKSPDDRIPSATLVAQKLQQGLSQTQTPDQGPASPQGQASVREAAETAVPEPSITNSSVFGRSFKRFCAVVMLGVFGWMGYLVYLETSKGTLCLETNGDVSVPVRIVKSDQTVDKLTLTKNGAVVRLQAGEYELQIDDQFDSFEIDRRRITLERGGHWIARISLKPNKHRNQSDEFDDTPTGAVQDPLAYSNEVDQPTHQSHPLTIPEIEKKDADRTVQVMFTGPAHVMFSDDPPASKKATFYSLPHRVNYGYESDILVTFQDKDHRVRGVIKVAPPTNRTLAYLRHNAIPVQFSADELRRVAAGEVVRKVSFLPNPEHQTDAITSVDTITSYRVPAGVNVVEESRKRGSPLITLTLTKMTSENDFGIETHIEPTVDTPDE